MALRYVARRVGVPGLRRASGPRVSPSTASGPLASRSSQAGYSNGDAAQKMKKKLGSSLTEEKNASGSDAVARIKASYQSTIDAIERSKRMEKLHRRLNMGSSVAGIGLGLYIFSCIPREAIEEALRK
ncbi:unnamed protein product [Urochloa decumbens]|uniref:Uncharacterized protein n=2 Tax=Urochloa decumbens TaxID=240449 RepID=A0ABC9GDJ6_9POAL